MDFAVIILCGVILAVIGIGLTLSVDEKFSVLIGIAGIVTVLTLAILRNNDRFIPSEFSIESRTLVDDCYTINTRYVQGNAIKDSTFYMFNNRVVISCAEKH